MTDLSEVRISAGKRLGIESSEWLPGWFTSWSPRNGNMNAEGQWCQWVVLARMILAHELTKEQMPEFHMEFEDPCLYDAPHPDCLHCKEKQDDV